MPMACEYYTFTETRKSRLYKDNVYVMIWHIVCAPYMQCFTVHMG